MYKWLSGLLSGTSNTLHCSGANSHNFIMFLSQLAFFPNISSLTRLVKQRSRLPPKICISGLQSCRSKLAIMTWSELQRAQRQGHKHKVEFSAVACFLGSSHGRGWCGRQCCCTHMHHGRKCPVGAACKAAFVCTNTPSTLLLPDFSAAGNSSEWLTRKGFPLECF